MGKCISSMEEFNQILSKNNCGVRESAENSANNKKNVMRIGKKRIKKYTIKCKRKDDYNKVTKKEIGNNEEGIKDYYKNTSDRKIDKYFDNIKNENKLDKKNKKSKKNKKNKKNKDKGIIEPRNRKRIMQEFYVQRIINKEILIFLGGKLYIYENEAGFYRYLDKHQAEVIIKDNIKKRHRNLLIDSDIRGIYKLLIADSLIQKRSSEIKDNEWLINCNNFTVDLHKKRKIDHSPNHYFFNKLEVDKYIKFNKEVFKRTNFYRFLDEITKGDKELKKLLQEITGYTISNFSNAKKMVLLYGVSNSGKSVYLDLLQHIIGENSVSNIPLQRLSDETYSVELENKVANIYNELPDEGIRDLGAIKALVSPNDKVVSRKLYQQPTSFKNKATLIFSTNSLPEINVKIYNDTSAFYNRVIIIPFMNQIEEGRQDKELISKLKSESDIIFSWALDGLYRYIENNFTFSKCNISESYLKKYRSQQNYISSYINEYLEENDDVYIFWEDIKKSFKSFVKDNGKKDVSFKEYQYLKDVIQNYFKVEYSRIHRGNQNKWGFRGISFK